MVHGCEASSTNAWNLNLSNGNANNWNTKASNQGRVRPVSALLQITKICGMMTTEDMLEAYYDCRRKKRRTASAVTYELDYESKLIALKNRINNRTYLPGKSICFVVPRPRYREVFAAAFEDRIVHHLISLRLEPLFESVFSPRTFNCRKGKGQMFGAEMLYNDIRVCSDNYTQDCYIMKLDLQSFFMSIDRLMLAKMIDAFIRRYYKGEDIDDLRYLCGTVVLHAPEQNCERHSPTSYWTHLPANKSLFTNGENKGVAIGNLWAQLFANFLLNVLDWYILKDMGFVYTGRYVDDLYIIDADKGRLLEAVPKIRKLLAGYGLKLSPTKFYFQHYTKGVAFTGSVIKCNRKYAGSRTVSNFVKAVLRLNKAGNIEEIEHAVCSINSYLGFLRHGNTYNIRKKILRQIDIHCFEWIYIRGHYEVVAIKKKYRKRTVTLQRIQDGIR